MLVYIRWFCLTGSFLVFVLAVISLVLGSHFYQDLALAVSVLGTAIVTILTARVVRNERDGK